MCELTPLIKLADLCRCYFQPYVREAMLTFLGAFSGLTPTPICIEIAGDSRVFRRIALVIQTVLGDGSTLFATSVTESALVPDPEHSRRVYVFEDISADANARRTMHRILGRRRVSIADTKFGDSLRIRELRCPVAIILLNVEFEDFGLAVASILRVRLPNQVRATRAELEGVISAESQGSEAELSRLATEMQEQVIKSLESAVAIESAVAKRLPSTLNELGDAECVRRVLSLANVAASLALRAKTNSLPIDRDSVTFVLALLASVDVQDQLPPKTPTQHDTIEAIRRTINRKTIAKTPTEFAAMEATFTVNELRADRVFQQLSPQAIHDRLHMMEAIGLAEQVGRGTKGQVLWRPMGAYQSRGANLAGLIDTILGPVNQAELSPPYRNAFEALQKKIEVSGESGAFGTGMTKADTPHAAELLENSAHSGDSETSA